MFYKLPWVLNFSLFRSIDSRAWGNGQLENCASNDPQMTLKATRSKVLHMYYSSTIESQISITFVLQPAVFDLQAILRKVHQCPQNDLEHYNIFYKYALQVPPVPNFNLLHCSPAVLSCRPFWYNCTKSPPNDLKSDLMYPIYAIYKYPQVLKFNPFCCEVSRFFNLQIILWQVPLSIGIFKLQI